MLRIVLGCLLVIGSAWAQTASPPDSVVYCWPMTSAFDQYLAQAIAAQGQLTVVSDPERASVVLTERIDDRFQSALDHFFPPEEKEESEAESESNIDGDGFAAQRANRPRGEPKGNLFLVDIATRQVLWSTYVGDFQRTPDKMRKKAKSVAGEIRPGG